MNYKITGNSLLDYAIIPGAVLGVLPFLASSIGTSGANTFGETFSVIDSFPAIFLVSVTAIVLLSYDLSKREKSFWKIIFNGALVGLVIHVVSSALQIIFGSSQQTFVTRTLADSAKEFIALGILWIIFFAAIALIGIVFKVVEYSFVQQSKKK